MMNDVVLGKCPASSAKGKSSMRTCIRIGCMGKREGGGRNMVSERVERMCVILYDVSSAGFSANAKSEMYSRGIISLMFLAGRV